MRAALAKGVNSNPMIQREGSDPGFRLIARRWKPFPGGEGCAMALARTVAQHLVVLLLALASADIARAQIFAGSTGTVANNTCAGGGSVFIAAVNGLGKAFEVERLTLSTSGSGGFERHYFLEGPNGKVLEISTGNGSGFANYSNTVFTDSAAQTIGNNLVGTFKPEGRSEQIECSPVGIANSFTFASQFGGINVDGTWKLHVLDTAAGNTGSVSAWSVTFVESSLPPIDVAVTAINVPEPACFAEPQAVSVEVVNDGLDDIAVGALSLTLDGAENPLAPISNDQLIASGDSSVLTFTGVELSQACEPYLLSVIATLEGDEVVENNTASAFTRNLCGDCPAVIFSLLDSGVGSLRQAILDANSSAGPVVLSFAIPGEPPYRIELLSELPVITNTVTIDGTTQPGFAAAGGAEGEPQAALAATPVIEVAGAGLVLNNAPGSIIRALALDEGPGNGIQIEASDNVVIEACHIGMDPGGQTGTGFALSGVFIEGSAGCEVRDSLISKNTGNGVVITGESADTTVQGCVIGLAMDGASEAGNGASGIVVQNSDNVVIGGESAAERNVISENLDGIHVRDADGLQILNNFIGRDIAGAGGFALGNFDDGIDAAGITNALIKRNVIANNSDQGIVIGGASSQVQIEGNLLGWNADGLVSIGNGGNNLLLAAVAGPVVIGGAAADQRNLIGAADGNGISAVGSSGVEIRSNLIGVNANGVGAAGDGNAAHGVRLESTTATVRSNVISGNGADGISLFSASIDCVIEGNIIGLQTDGTTLFGNARSGIKTNGSSTGLRIGGVDIAQRNVVSANGGDGIDVDAADAQIVNNFIGVDIGGTLDRGNGGDGLEVVGPSLVSRNVISGNSRHGIFFTRSNNIIEGNRIGVDVTGTAMLGNAGDGIFLERLSGVNAGNRIGGVSVEQRNVIAGNGGSGIATFQGEGVVVLNNFIGVDVTGTAPLGNAGAGIALTRGDDWQIGAAGAGNVISANGVHGIVTSAFTDRVLILANFIGTDLSASLDLGNGQSGIEFAGTDSEIGGTAEGEANEIRFNSAAGLVLIGFDTLVLGNRILDNGTHGILVDGVTDNRIGGSDLGAGNTIARNGAAGVALRIAGGFFPLRNVISVNSTFANTGLGIDLGDDGGTPNDPGDADNGPNNLQNFPVLATADSATGRITGALNSEANRTYRIELFSNVTADESGHGEGETFLGSVEAITDDSGNAAFVFDSPAGLIAGHFMTATATDPDGNTSEFSEAIGAGGPGAPTSTPTSTPTHGPTNTPTPTATSTPTHTATSTPTFTPDNTGTATHTPTITATHTPTITATHTPTITATHTPTITATFTPTATASLTPTSTPTSTPTHSPTNTPTPTATSTPTHTATSTPTFTPDSTGTATHTPTVTATLTPTTTASLTPTSTPTSTPTVTPTVTVTVPPTITPTITPITTATSAPTVTSTNTPAGPEITSGFQPGSTRVFGRGAPNLPPGSILICGVGPNRRFDNCAFDDMVLGSGGTDAAGNLISSPAGIAVSPPLQLGNSVCVFDAMNGMAGRCLQVGATPVPVPAPALSWPGLALVLLTLLELARVRLRRNGP
jgi:parallel beta-helix repeat protein